MFVDSKGALYEIEDLLTKRQYVTSTESHDQTCVVVTGKIPGFVTLINILFVMKLHACNVPVMLPVGHVITKIGRI